MAVDNSVRACARWPVAAYSVPRPRWQWACERAHAQSPRPGPGPAGSRLRPGRHLGARDAGSLAEETVRMRLVAASCVGAGEFEEASWPARSPRPRGRRGAEPRSAQASTSAWKNMRFPVDNALEHLVQERQALGEAPGGHRPHPRGEALMGKTEVCWRYDRGPDPVRARGWRCRGLPEARDRPADQSVRQ